MAAWSMRDSWRIWSALVRLLGGPPSVDGVMLPARHRPSGRVVAATKACQLCSPHAIFSALRYLGPTGAPWRHPPSDFPHWRWSISRRGAESRQAALKRFAVITLGHPRALSVTPAHDDERSQVGALATQAQAVADVRLEIACLDSGYIGPEPAASAAKPSLELVVVKTPQAQWAVVLPQRTLGGSLRRTGICLSLTRAAMGGV
jgi:transposase